MHKYLVLILGFLIPWAVLAAGIQVSPARLELKLTGSQTQATAELVVANPTTNVEIFRVYPDAFAENISIMPESFTLEAGGRKTVKIVVAPANQSEIISTTLSVLSRPLAEGGFQANTGVKIPLNVSTERTGTKNYKFWYLVGALLALAAGSAWSKKRN